MNAEQLQDAIGKIDDKYIAEAACYHQMPVAEEHADRSSERDINEEEYNVVSEKKSITKFFRFMIPAAACMIFVISVSLLSLNHQDSNISPVITSETTESEVITSDISEKSETRMTAVTSVAENTNITSVTSPESYTGTSAFQNTNQLSGRVSSAPVTEIHTKKESINTAGNTEAQKLSEITSKEKVSQTSKSVTYTTTGKTSTETEYTGTRPVTTISEKPQTSATVPDTTVIVKPSETRKITLDDILRLSHKGSELDWSDFNEYEYTDVGSGLFIFEYRLEESEYKDYAVLVGGLPEKKPYYVELRPLDYSDRRSCDLTSSSEEEILAFLKGNNSEQNYISGFDALSLHKECNYSLQSISVESLPGGYSYSFINDNNMYKVWDYLSELKLKADFPENPDEYDGMTWVITLTCAAGHTETIYHFGNMFIRGENSSWYKMDYDQATGFKALLEELEYN